jgi:hypothetical protein
MRILAATLLALAWVGGHAFASAAVDAVPGEVIVKVHDQPAKVRYVPLKSNVRGAATQLARDPHVEWAQPNYYQRGAAPPNDALYGQEWSLPAIGAPAAWDHTTGSDAVRVAIVDSGINAGEPDLAPNVRMDSGGTSSPTTPTRRTTRGTAPTSRASWQPAATTAAGARQHERRYLLTDRRRHGLRRPTGRPRGEPQHR